MLKNLRTVLMVVLSIVATMTQSKAQTLIHYWHFNDYALGIQYTDTIHGVAADYSMIDTSKAKILYAEMAGTSASYSTHLDTVQAVATDYDTVNLRMGAASGAALRVRNPSDSMQLYFYIPTNGFKDIILNYASQSSSVSHGQLHQVFDYSTDSGATWKTSGLSMASDSAWLVYHRTTLTFTTDTTVDNNGGLIFRITFAGNTTGTSGNNRFDNVTVEGTPIPTAAKNIAAENINIILAPNPTTGLIDVIAEKAITPLYILNLSGSIVKQLSSNTSTNKFDVSELASGKYFLVYRLGGAVKSLAFTKL